MKTRVIRVMSCGAKHGPAPESADLFIDCRGFINPFYDKSLRSKTGAANAVKQYLERSDEVIAMREAIGCMLKAMLPGLVTRSNYHSDILLAFMCTGGQHRSRYFAIEAQRMAREIVSANPGWGDVRVVLNHRDKAQH